MIDKDIALRALDQFIAKAQERLDKAISLEDYGDAAHISGYKGGLEMARIIIVQMEEA